MAIIVLSLVVETPYIFLGVFAIISVLSINELHNLASAHMAGGKAHAVIKAIDMAGAVAIFLSLYYLYNGVSHLGLVALPALVYFVARMVAQLYVRSGNNVLDLALSALCTVYVAMPLGLLNVIYFGFSPATLLAALILIWVNDTGAYCIGTPLGRHRLFLRVSPKKSWEGFWGGLVACLVVSALFSHFDGYFGGGGLAWWLGFGVVTSVFATWGDLCESLIKRTFAVKDSSNLLPGHGGILDRNDSLLIVTPAILVYLTVTAALS